VHTSALPLYINDIFLFKAIIYSLIQELEKKYVLYTLINREPWHMARGYWEITLSSFAYFYPHTQTTLTPHYPYTPLIDKRYTSFAPLSSEWA
jgi:hypothetical protein